MQAIKSPTEIIIHIDEINYVSYTSGENIVNPLYKSDLEMGETALCMPEQRDYIILNGNHIDDVKRIIDIAIQEGKNILKLLIGFFYLREAEFGSSWSTLSKSSATVTRDSWLIARNLQ